MTARSQRAGLIFVCFVADSLADVRWALKRERDARVADGRRVLQLTAVAQDHLVAESIQDSTLNKYERDFKQVCSELNEYGLHSGRLTVSAWMAYLSIKVCVDNVSAARLADLAAAVSHQFRRGTLGGPNPVESRRAKGLFQSLKKRQRLVKPRKPSRVLTRSDVASIFCDFWRGASVLSPVQMRNRALFLVQCATGLRARSLVPLRRCDFQRRAQGYLIHIAKSKTSSGVGTGSTTPRARSLSTWVEITEKSLWLGWMAGVGQRRDL